MLVRFVGACSPASFYLCCFSCLTAQRRREWNPRSIAPCSRRSSTSRLPDLPLFESKRACPPIFSDIGGYPPPPEEPHRASEGADHAQDLPQRVRSLSIRSPRRGGRTAASVKGPRGSSWGGSILSRSPYFARQKNCLRACSALRPLDFALRRRSSGRGAKVELGLVPPLVGVVELDARPFDRRPSLLGPDGLTRREARHDAPRPRDGAATSDEGRPPLALVAPDRGAEPEGGGEARGGGGPGGERGVQRVLPRSSSALGRIPLG